MNRTQILIVSLTAYTMAMNNKCEQGQALWERFTETTFEVSRTPTGMPRKDDELQATHNDARHAWLEHKEQCAQCRTAEREIA